LLFVDDDDEGRIERDVQWNFFVEHRENPWYNLRDKDSEQKPGAQILWSSELHVNVWWVKPNNSKI
jgi:hypothetical protein